MSRLSGGHSRLGKQASRLKGPAANEAKRSRLRYQTQPWRAWYSTPRWRALRLAALKRDGWRCRQTGELLIGGKHEWNSPIVDHIKQHNGDPDLFWDLDNLQSVTKRWHDKTKQSLERRGFA